MGGFSDYAENALLNHVLGTSTFTKPSAVYVGLYTAAPTDAGGGTEVSGNAYARQAATFGAASGGSASNSGAVTFPAATPAGWGVVTHFGIFDALTSGNLLAWGSLGASKDIAAADQATFAAGALVVTLD
jgi:hypothetical protein